MNPDTTNELIRALTVFGYGALAFAYTAFLALWVARRVRPAVPDERWLPLAAAAAVVTVALTATVTELWAQAALAAFIPILIVAASIDSKTKRIPNIYTIHGLCVAGAVAGAAALTGSVEMVGTAATAGIITFVAFLALNIGSRNGFGMGDVKLGAVMVFIFAAVIAPAWSGSGLALIDNLMLATLCTAWAFLSFLIGGVWILVSARRGRSGVPFGPFMAAAWFIAVAGAPLIADLMPNLS